MSDGIMRRLRKPVVKSVIPADVAGFTLLEVMIAVAIMAIALVSLLHLVVRGIDNADYDQTLTLATLYARSILAEGLIKPDDERDGEGEGEDVYERFKWKRTVTPTIFNRIEEMKVTVTWIDQGEDRSIELSQYIFTG